VCTLCELHSTLKREALASPSVMVIGDVLQGLLALQAPQNIALACL
jgi:uroporphyrin-III C-methyltransferase